MQKNKNNNMNNNNHKNEIEIAIRNNILQFNIESEEELYDIYEIASKLKITTNICLVVVWTEHNHLVMKIQT